MKYFEGLSQEDKMKMWHDGTRGFNVDAASDEKLKANLDICKKLKFKTEAALIAKELELRSFRNGTKKVEENLSLVKQFLEGDMGDGYDTGAVTSGDFQAFAPERVSYVGSKKNDIIYKKAFTENVELDDVKTAIEICEDYINDPTDKYLLRDFFKYANKEFEPNDIITNVEDYEELVNSFTDYLTQDTINYELCRESKRK